MRFTGVLAGLGLAASSAWAGQGVVLTPGQTIGFEINNVAPYSTITSTRLEFRLHAWSIPSSPTNVFSVPQFQVRLEGAGYNAPLAITDWLDIFPDGQSNTLYFDISEMTDVIVRVQRDTVANTFSGQVWNANGTGQPLTSSLAIQALVGAPLPTTAQMGDSLTSCVLDYVRWFSSTVAPSTSPFKTSTGDVGDWEFEGSLVDTSQQGVATAATGLAAYSPSPVYPPLASQGAQRVFRAGVPAVLDGTGSAALNGLPTLTYLWSQISGPTQLAWSSVTSPQPTITGLVFGSYQIQLQATDSSGQSSTCILKYGSVFTNPNDVVITSAPYLSQILGPMLRLGANPWPYFDSSHQSMADFFGGLQSSDYLDVWNTAQNGVVSVSNGSSAVTGVGTSFLSTFCGNGSSGVNGATLVIWYPVPGSPGQFGRAPYAVASCESDTALTLTTPYTSSGDTGGASFAFMDNNSIGTWINGSSNANYYDNVLAFYNLYYRSGLDDYLNYARTLADRWYTMPWFDEGRASQSGYTFLFPRLQSLTGLILRAFDGHPEYWSGIELYANADYNFANTAPVAGYALNDIREQGYATAFVSLAALFDPNPANQATYKSQVTSLISQVWAPSAQPAGNWVNGSYGYATWNDTGGTVTVQQGSDVVTGTGTNWESDWFNGNAVWTADTNGVTNGDAISYTATVMSPTMITLNQPYQGPSATSRGWQSSNLVGVGTQPFMLGIVAEGFRLALLVSGDSRLLGYLSNIAGWVSTMGYRPDARGLWYGRGFPNCEPISTDNLWCSGGSVEQSRFLSGEIVGMLSAAYIASPQSAIKSFGDNIYGAMFGGPTGGPDSDSIYVNDIQPGGWAMQTKYAKDFGFFFGFGGGPSWPASRLYSVPAAGRPR